MGTERTASLLRAAGFGGRIESEYPLARLTTWRIGGPAELLVQPENLEDLRIALRWAAAREFPWRVLGNGSNLLVRDEGVRGLVLLIKKALEGMRVDGPRIEAGAGVSFPALAREAASHGLAGLEFAAGIPGTLGGALVMNASWHKFEIGNFVDSVDSLTAAGELESADREACAFEYRRSRFRDRKCIVVGAKLTLEPGQPDEIRRRLEGFAASRKANQPTELPSCGSVFLKPPDDFAGRLIDEAGLKGLQVGSIQVSTKHANFFVNLGGGTAAQVLELVERVEREVETRFGVRLVREFELW